MQKIIVSKTGEGFATVGEALRFVEEKNLSSPTIFIGKGVYIEPVETYLAGLTLVGKNTGETIISFDYGARDPHPEGGERGTFRTASFFAGGNDFTAENLTFRNTFGRGAQALAFYVAGDRAVFRNCEFHGFQDTIFTGSLPKAGVDYAVPEQTNAVGNRVLFEGCFISGDVDFLFGPSTAVFHKCCIYSRDRDGYITAASTPKQQTYGFIFKDCIITGNAPKHSTYLGRPWRDYAHVLFMNCYLDQHIRPEGWHNWREPHREQTSRFMEYDNLGPGWKPDQRVPWAAILTEEQAKQYDIFKILAGHDHWNPQKG